MSAIVQTRSPFENPFEQRPRSIVIHPPSRQDHPSHVGQSSSMGPPNTSPEVEQRADSNGSSPQQARESSSALSAAHGSKVVQTAFIHKLYSMLEDKSIEHLITWSGNGDSFIMSPSNEFSKVLAQYFKHTNISSFVRQLNMYGFHKVSDVFHTGSSESAQWEFRHGNNNFKKGDLMGLREIKRRASRHTLIHRDSFANPPTKPGPVPPGVPAEILQDPEQRMAYMEGMMNDMYARSMRTEDNYAMIVSRFQNLNDNLAKCHQWIRQLSNTMHTALPSDSPLRNDLSNIQKEVDRQQDMLRASEFDNTPNGRMAYYGSSMAMDGPVSPRGHANPDSRRSSIQISEPPLFNSRPPVPPMPPQFSSISPRRFGSISAAHTSPGFSKPALPTPTQPHPLSNVTSPPPNLARRHTSADIREHWPPHTNGSPFAAGGGSVQWQPPSPNQAPDSTGDTALQNQLATYQINPSRRSTITADHDSVPPTQELAPPTGLGVGNVSWGAGVSKFPRPNFELHSAPATRRSSMASNVHSLLNPADTAEQENEDDGGPLDDRKRKRVVWDRL